MKREVTKEYPDRPPIEAEFMQLDLASFHSVRMFINAFTKRNSSLDILINNAGVFYVHFGKAHSYVVCVLINTCLVICLLSSVFPDICSEN